MNYSDIRTFVSDLEKLVEFFSELAAKENELIINGMRYATTWESYAVAKPLFQDFDTRLFELQRFSRFVDKQLWESLTVLVETSKIADLIGRMAVTLKVSEKKKAVADPVTLVASIFIHMPYISRLYNNKKLFADETISIHSVLVGLNRIISLAKTIASIYISKWSSDDEIFKPSNLDQAKIIEFVDLAIADIEASTYLSADQRKQLIGYLYKAKTELADDRPSWNKIVGAFVITATVLSGIADAPQAIDNVNAAIKYILGHSVDRHLPPSLRQIEQKPEMPLPKDDTGIADSPTLG